MVAVLVGVVIAAAALGPTAASAAAEVLVSQPPGPSGIAVPAEETVPWGGPYDDFVVPHGAHWNLEAIRVFGTATTEHLRTFNVRIYWGGGVDEHPLLIEPLKEFQEQVTVAGGPDYLIPLEGPPALFSEGISLLPNVHWISVQAVDTGGEDDWSWLTGPDTPGTAPLYSFEKPAGAEPGLAFELLGMDPETVKAQVSGSGTLVSSPPGISCPGTCTAEFPRGTTLSFTATPKDGSQRFVEWGFRQRGVVGFVPAQVPSPCGGTGGCSFTLDEDTNVGAVFEPIDELDVLRVVRDRRAGKGRLLVWIPGPGALGLFSEGLRPYSPGTMPGGVDRIPLVPTKKVAKTLHQKGHVTVPAEVTFRPFTGEVPTTVAMELTLVRKRPHRPVHKPRDRVH